jgi:hypothetical protein
MKLAIAVFLAASFIASIGCHQRSSRPSVGFHVAWPNEPKEYHLEDIGKETWNYFAIYRDEERHLVYSLSVWEFGPAAANMGPQRLLASAREGDPGQELSRVDTEYGPAKHPAVEIHAKVCGDPRAVSVDGKTDRVERAFVVLSGTRTYHVNVIGSDKAALETQAVVAFLHSLVIEQ